jgi:hypothetical protein
MPENDYNDQIHRSLFTHKVAQAKEASYSQFTPRLLVNAVRE